MDNMKFEDRYFIKVVVMDEYIDDFMAELEYEKLLLTHFVGEDEAELLCDDDACPSIGDADDMG